MVKVLLVVPYKELQEKFETYVSQLDTHDMEIDIFHLYGTRFAELGIDFKQYRVVAARGITGHSLREMHPSAAFVEISTTGDDIVSSLTEAVKRFGRQPMAVVLPDSNYCNIEQIAALSGLELEVFYVHDEDDVSKVTAEIQQRGIRCVVGGLTVYAACQKIGIPVVPIVTADATVRRTVSIALETARSIDQERMKRHLMRTLLDSHHDGVLACDTRGIILSSNTRACHQLTNGTKTVPEIINHHIDELLPDSGWEEVMESGTARDSMREFSDGITIMHCSPMMADGEVTGLVFTIQNADMIRDSDSRIQREVTRKGFTAQYTFHDIIVQNPQMLQRLVSAHKYAKTDANVLILGETGTGKEMFAQSIHNAGARSNYPFVAINCAAMPEHLLESELFGYSDGAFSGAKKGGKQGLFETAHKGTIFLDEIGEMPINLQAKLLRVLQERHIRRIGDNKLIPVDVRVISATNISIREKIAEGKFRSDLYYRINLLELRLPPLRDRPEDIELIFSKLLDRYSKSYKLPVPRVSPEAAALLRRQPWLGNVRELSNFSERLVILSEGAEITPEQLEFAGLFDTSTPLLSNAPSEALPRQRKEDIARELGISRTTLWRRSKQEKEAAEKAKPQF